jgi:hypothetical protein
MSVSDETVIAAVTAAVETMTTSAAVTTTVTTTVIMIASMTAMGVADVAMRTAITTNFAARGSATAPRC